jgi:hypothetical protein
MFSRSIQKGKEMRGTIVSGNDFVGLFAADGSLNVIEAPSPIEAFIGSIHPSGALYVTLVDGLSFVGLYASDGSIQIVDEAGGIHHPCGAYRVQLT